MSSPRERRNLIEILESQTKEIRRLKMALSRIGRNELSGLLDVTIDGTPASGEVLVADGADGWANATLAEAGISSNTHDHDADYDAIGTAASAVSTHEADASAHHSRYADAEAVAAMGTKADGNALNHDRYTDAEADARIALADITDLASYAHADTSGKTASDHHDHTGGGAYCSLQRGSPQQTIPSGTWTAIVWNAENHDPQGWHSTSTNPERITPDLPAGTVLGVSFFQDFYTPSGSPTQVGVRLLRSGSEVYSSWHPVTNSNTFHADLSCICRHFSGNYYTIELWHDSGSDEQIRIGSDDSDFTINAFGGLDAT